MKCTEATHSAVVYDAITGQPLRVIVPDYAEQLDDPLMIAPNEKYIRIPKVDYTKMTNQEMCDAVEQAVALVMV